MRPCALAATTQLANFSTLPYIRKTAKGGGALHRALDLILAKADTGVQPMTMGDSIESLSTTSEDTDPSPTRETIPHDWFAPLPTTEMIRRRRHKNVSLDPKYNH